MLVGAPGASVSRRDESSACRLPFGEETEGENDAEDDDDEEDADADEASAEDEDDHDARAADAVAAVSAAEMAVVGPGLCCRDNCMGIDPLSRDAGGFGDVMCECAASGVPSCVKCSDIPVVDDDNPSARQRPVQPAEGRNLTGQRRRSGVMSTAVRLARPTASPASFSPLDRRSPPSPIPRAAVLSSWPVVCDALRWDALTGEPADGRRSTAWQSASAQASIDWGEAGVHHLHRSAPGSRWARLQSLASCLCTPAVSRGRCMFLARWPRAAATSGTCTRSSSSATLLRSALTSTPL